MGRGREHRPDVAAWRAKTDAELLSPAEFRERTTSLHVVGVMGYAGRWRSVDGDPAVLRSADARRLLRAELIRRKAEHGERLLMVSGATNSGVLKLAYAECVALAIRAAGVTAEEALRFGLATMDVVVSGGRRFGDESRLFVETAEEFIVLGGGAQSLQEARMAAALGKPVTVIRGFGGAADALSVEDVPTARFIERS
jgi:hypothetical protein